MTNKKKKSAAKPQKPEAGMTEEEQKELYEWYKKVYDYEPDIEDVKARYSDEFNKKLREHIHNM